ncbi:hypothetical protein [Arachidicoccus terrestris]|uniref:hypothetical protein n=1 Tax=Arachidicoccus terrestris TaxID=2875539 RepID=UPI001CC49AD0|nr:hypothetical protein [Arachidicoccus terrestris]UAY53977.1 hypothetical protein K9M52_10890 [Arachidicoccus terrestris]
MRKFAFLFFLAGIICTAAGAQELPSPHPGKALVIFERPPVTAFAVQFRLFDSTKYLGLISAGGHLVYECTPGKKLFWALSENRDFLEADLEANQVYLIQTLVQAGAVKARVKLQPYDPKDKRAEKIKRQFIKRIDKGKEKKAETITEGTNQKVIGQAINRGMERYQKLKDKNKKITRLAADMHT